MPPSPSTSSIQAADPLALADRPGLPDEIAYLRSTYPQPTWRRHTNFGQLAGLWLHVHDYLRSEGASVGRLVDQLREGTMEAETFQRLFVRRLNDFVQHLDMHHRNEDLAYFPRFRTLDARMVVGFNLLEADHAVIEEKLRATVENARGLLAALPFASDTIHGAADDFAVQSERLLHLLIRHLADEEELVIPALLEYGERPVL